MPGRHKPRLHHTRAAVRDALDEARVQRETPPAMPTEDPVDLASADSMDASDPPSFTATTSGGNTRPSTEDRGR